MGDNLTPPVVVTPTPPGPTPPENGGDKGQPQPIDFTKIPDDQIGKVLEDQRLWNTPRLKDLREKAKRADELDAAEKKRQDDELKKKGEYETLITEKDKKIAELEGTVSTTRLNGAIERAATKAGVVDSEAALALIDKSLIKLEDNGTLTGVDEAIKKLLEAKPYLKGEGGTPTLGTPSNPDNTAQLKRFTKSQIENVEFYRANEKDILASQKAGLIIDDRK